MNIKSAFTITTLVLFISSAYADDLAEFFKPVYSGNNQVLCRVNTESFIYTKEHDPGVGFQYTCYSKITKKGLVEQVAADCAVNSKKYGDSAQIMPDGTITKKLVAHDDEELNKFVDDSVKIACGIARINSSTDAARHGIKPQAGGYTSTKPKTPE